MSQMLVLNLENALFLLTRQFLNLQDVIISFKDYDLIIDASDNIGTRYLINDACLQSTTVAKLYQAL